MFQTRRCGEYKHSTLLVRERNSTKTVALLLFLLLVLVLFGLGFTLHFLWIAAAVIFIFWLAGFAFRSGSGGSRRWYYW